MCIAVNTTWRNTGITDTDICVLAKRNRDSKLIWSRKLPPQPPPISTPSPSPNFDSKDIKTLDHREDHQWSIGECISYDNVGPINPESIEGYRQFIAFRDTRSKYLFCYPVKTCNEETFLYYLERVLRFFTTRGFKPRILRSDYYTTFRSHKANLFYEEHQCRHESSAPYQQWQNAVERDIQTTLSNVSATIHGQDFLRADIWAHALIHWTRLHNFTPHAVIKDTPARLIDPNFFIDAHHQYRFAFGDLLCFPLQDHERLWKFDV
jgi:hypothetical protein